MDAKTKSLLDDYKKQKRERKALMGSSESKVSNEFQCDEVVIHINETLGYFIVSFLKSNYPCEFVEIVQK